MEKQKFIKSNFLTLTLAVVLLAVAGFVFNPGEIKTPTNSENANGCVYTIILTVAPYSTGSWCMQGGLGSQLYQADGNGIATFSSICLGTYYFCDASGTVYIVVVDGSAFNYYPVAASVRCPC